MRVAQHVDQVGVDIFNLRGVRIQKQDAVLCRFKQTAVAAFGNAQGFLRGISLWPGSAIHDHLT
ncbi:MAG: hypothetical protein Q8K87_10015 [Hydrogenophaga sp.]|nr:hypothetical protein [Hydrogenophaga sp.]